MRDLAKSSVSFFDKCYPALVCRNFVSVVMGLSAFALPFRLVAAFPEQCKLNWVSQFTGTMQPSWEFGSAGSHTASWRRCKVVPVVDKCIGELSLRSCFVANSDDQMFSNPKYDGTRSCAGIYYIGSFTGCEKLTSFKIESGCAFGGSGNAPYYFDPDFAAKYLLEFMQAGSMPLKIDSMEIGAFKSCTSLVLFSRDESLANYNLPADAFRDCVSLRSCNHNANSIGESAFEGCTSLREHFTGNKVTNIAFRAFANCTVLERIRVGSNVASIEKDAFVNTPSLVEVEFLGPPPRGIEESLILANNPKVSFPESYAEEWRSVLIKPIVFEVEPEQGKVVAGGVYAVDVRLADPEDGFTVRYALAAEGPFVDLLAVSDGEIASEIWCEVSAEDYYPVTNRVAVREIATSAFAGRKDITAVTVPDSVKKIGNLAFANCVGLTTVVLPQGLELIDQGVFAGCSALRSVSIPESVTLIGIGAFSGCESLESLTLPSGLVTIDQGAFSSCSHLGSIVIPSNVATIGGYAFSDCVGLKTLTILAPYVRIGEFAFVGCTSLSLATMPESVEDVGARAFWDCTALADASGFIVINTVLYGYCGQAKNLVIPDSISRVGNYALVWNEDIVSVVVPATVRAVGENAFYGCRELSSVTLMEGLTAIGAHAFEFCEKLTSLTVPSSVTSIGEHACYYLSGLKSLTVFGGLTSVGSEAFCFCGGFEPRSSVPNLGIVAQDGERIKQLLDDAGLDTSNAVISAPCVITFNANGGTPESVRRVMAVGAEYGPMPFVTREKCIFDGWFTQIEGGEKIGSTSVAAGDATLYAHWVPMDGEFVGDVSGIRYSFHSSDGKVSVAGCGELASGELQLPTSYAGLPITGIADGAFFGRADIVKIVLPDTFETVGHHAFACCSNLVSVKMGDAISSVGRYAFAGCPRVVEFTMPSKVTVAGLPKDASLNQIASVSASAHPVWTEDIWDGLVAIDYTVLGASVSGFASVAVRITATDGETVYPVTTVSGDLSASVGPHSVEWDVAADFGKTRPQGLTVKVELVPKDGSDEVIPPLVGEYESDLSLESFRTTFGSRTSEPFAFDLDKAVPLRYSLASDGSAVITQGAYTSDGRILIPDLIDGHPISGVREGAFPPVDGGARFVLPVSTTAFDTSTTAKWSGLKDVTSVIVFPQGVTLFQVAAFRQFQNLTKVVFEGGPENLSDSLLAYLKTSGLEVVYRDEFASAWQSALSRYVVPYVVVLSAGPRSEDPTVMDVAYSIGGTVKPTKARVLAFKDNERSFAKVVRPVTFVGGTEAEIGDDMSPDAVHRFSWKVADDWQINLAKVRMEVLILPDDLLPLKFFTIPANGGNPAMTVSRNALTEQRVRDALLWLYADGDADLTLEDGVLKHGDTVLASGLELNGKEAVEFIFSKMGCRIMTEEELSYVNEVSRLGLRPEGVRQYAVKVGE